MTSLLEIKDTHYIYKTQAMLESCNFLHEMERIMYPPEEYIYGVYEWLNDRFYGSKLCRDGNEVFRFAQAEKARCKKFKFVVYDRNTKEIFNLDI